MGGFAMGGMWVDSDRPLLPGELAPGAGGAGAEGAGDGRAVAGRPVVRVSHATVDVVPPNAAFDGTPTFDPTDAGWRCVIPGQVAITVADSADLVSVAVAPGARADLVAHLILDQALPRLLALRGEVVLHATCVAHRGVALAFAGPTGAGKSSMAAALVRTGAPLVADDCLVVRCGPGGGAYAVPSYPATRLTTQALDVFGVAGSSATARAGKHLVAAPAGSEPVPLDTVFLLDRGPAGTSIRTEPMTAAVATLELARHSFNAALLGTPPDRDGVRALVSRLRPLIEHVAVRRLTYPSSFDALPDVLAVVRAEVNAPFGRATP